MTTKDYEGQISIVLGNPTHRKQDMADINCLEYFINDNNFFSQNDILILQPTYYII
jgi:hypothetical protein